MKSFQKSKTASFITLNSADDLFVFLLMVKMIVAQISGRHLFEHWKDAHNFHWPGKVKLYGCCKLMGKNQKYVSNFWVDCRGTKK